MLRSLRVVACTLALLAACYAQDNPNLGHQDSKGQTPTVRATTDNSKSQQTQQDGTDKRDHPWLSPDGVLAILGIATLGVIIWQAVKTHQAADAGKLASQAAARQVEHMIAAERPFILAEVRNNTEIWIRNCGKSAARFLYYDTFMKQEYPEFSFEDQEFAMRQPPYYGKYYASQTVVQINIPWLAPGDSRYFASFDSTVLAELDDRTMKALHGGSKAVRFYSAIKYRGISSDEIFETRFCYGWSSIRGLYETGPYGYNENT